MRTGDEFLRVEQLLSAGHADREVAQITGIPRRAVSGWRRGERQLRNRAGELGCPSDHDSQSSTQMHTPTCSVSISATATSRQGVATFGVSGSPSILHIPPSSVRALPRSKQSFRRRQRIEDNGPKADVSTSRCGRSFGPASSPSMALAASTCARFTLCRGSGQSLMHVTKHLSEDSFTATAPGSLRPSGRAPTCAKRRAMNPSRASMNSLDRSDKAESGLNARPMLRRS